MRKQLTNWGELYLRFLGFKQSNVLLIDMHGIYLKLRL